MVIKISDKKGWIKIVEAFVSILLILGVVLIVINKGYIGKEDISEEVYKTELSILRSAQLDDTLRRNILISNKSGYDFYSGESPLPVVWEEFDDQEQRVLKELKDKILRQVPSYLECKAKICEINNPCILGEEIDSEIYAQQATIVANYEVFNPRQLKLFCWVK